MIAKPILAGAAVAGLAAYFLYSNATLNHFFLIGSGTDAFWFAGLIWHMGPRMLSPIGIGEASFFGTHVSPFLYIPGLLSWIPGTRTVPFFAATMGVFHAIATASFGLSIGAGIDRIIGRPFIAGWAALLGGLATSVMPLQANFMQLPHYEILLPGLLTLFLLALALDRLVYAAVIFAVLLSVREDAGLHAATFLFTWSAALWLQHRTIDRIRITFAAIGIAWAGIAFFIGPILAGGKSQGVIYNLYLGRPLFHHMTIDQIAGRLEYFAYQCGHVWGPMAAVAFASVWRRDWVLLAGPVAVLPWLTLNVGFGAHPAPATLAFYYAFPILVVCVWPCLVAASRGPAISPRLGQAQWLTFGLQTAVLGLAFLPMFGPHLPFFASRWSHQNFLSTVGKDTVANYEDFAQVISKHADELGDFVASHPVVGTAPKVIPRRRWIEDIRLSERARLDRIDSVLLFDSPVRCAGAVEVANRTQVRHGFEIRGTNIVLLTRRSEADLPNWQRLLVRLPTGVALCTSRAPTTVE